jgi:hypothetical protein
MKPIPSRLVDDRIVIRSPPGKVLVKWVGAENILSIPEFSGPAQRFITYVNASLRGLNIVYEENGR